MPVKELTASKTFSFPLPEIFPSLKRRGVFLAQFMAVFIAGLEREREREREKLALIRRPYSAKFPLSPLLEFYSPVSSDKLCLCRRAAVGN